MSPKCKCGNEIPEEAYEFFGDLAECPSCVGIKTEAIKAADHIRKIITDLYGWKGEPGMDALKTQIYPTLKEFGIV